MVDGISTRLQREVGQHQKELERIESKLDGSVSTLLGSGTIRYGHEEDV